MPDWATTLSRTSIQEGFGTQQVNLGFSNGSSTRLAFIEFDVQTGAASGVGMD